MERTRVGVIEGMGGNGGEIRRRERRVEIGFIELGSKYIYY